ncbi:4-hydroxythreonine-4-phosphate dehydrogenase PdxA [Stieleria sp. TO1_6]|uniref:4-hydroxythreonine-4-phosphate dehydrogenase PdxA n=1 Tax=Stieleria tagensis TaxID=2956795 RepID=UPI00209B3F48|nr:4-hydroxythreonine-4-phosphate dehydrogenase PdxA [Stieleria tagensis]MCO8122083.1 4-hydroxythreonine-4-phosphate dehydrogenase PdxA [Stieleria tagensis]
MSTRPSLQRSTPRLGITVGDVAGVGPEIALACAADPTICQSCQPVLIGPATVIATIADRLSLPLPARVTADELFASTTTEPRLVDCGDIDLETLVPGAFSPKTGLASFLAVQWAIDQTLAGRLDAIVTGPIQKEAWHDAGTGFLGHTELLAERTGTSEFCMMLSGESCSTVLANIHLPLIDAIASLSIESIARAIRLGGIAMEKRFGRPPRITVLGLNPHAGENGLLSHGEEENLITPAIESVRQWAGDQQLRWQISGPVPPDTAFTPAMRAATDVHICMYHDQGLIPLKALSFDDAVNVTLGLPIVRTSVDHGTALDLAWQGTASRNSMLSAIGMAIDLCR